MDVLVRNQNEPVFILFLQRGKEVVALSEQSHEFAESQSQPARAAARKRVLSLAQDIECLLVRDYGQIRNSRQQLVQKTRVVIVGVCQKQIMNVLWGNAFLFELFAKMLVAVLVSGIDQNVTVRIAVQPIIYDPAA
jgi:hypothetical protein